MDKLGLQWKTDHRFRQQSPKVHSGAKERPAHLEEESHPIQSGAGYISPSFP